MMNLFRKIQRRTPSSMKPVILVTGCASGLGYSLAEQLFHYDEYRVVVTARKKSIGILKKRFVENDRFWILPLDVNSNEERTSVIKSISERWGEVHILINNAGVCYRSVVEHMNEIDEELQMNTNYLGPLALIRLVLPQMRARGRGKIINVSSVSGMLAMPTMASYSASKHALEGACEALWYEMKPLGINVSLVQPGFINSDSFENVRGTIQSVDSELHCGPYSDYYASMTPFIRKLMSLSPTGPDAVARKIMKVIRTENPPLWVPATLDAVVFYFLRKLMPRQLMLSVLFKALPNSRLWGRSYSRARHLERDHLRVEMQENVHPIRRTA